MSVLWPQRNLEFDFNYLNHSFIKNKSIGVFYYSCSKCNIDVYHGFDTDNGVQYFLYREDEMFLPELKLNCEEYIIKGIIE